MSDLPNIFIAKSKQVSQVLLIGDCPPNTHEEVITNRGDSKIWKSTKFEQPTHYLNELEKIIANDTVVHTFYVDSYAEVAFKEIAGRSGGQCHSLDIHSDKGADMLTQVVTE